MILLKSELKAKGCFPTALNFLFQCQMPCAEIARSRRPRRISPRRGCWSFGSTTARVCKSVLAVQFNIRKHNDRSTELSITDRSLQKWKNALLTPSKAQVFCLVSGIWFSFSWCQFDISVTPGRETQRRSGSWRHTCPLAWLDRWHEFALSLRLYAAWMLPILYLWFSIW